MKATIREMGKDEPDAVVAALRIASYPNFPEARQTEFYEELYRWHRAHPLGDQVRRWVAETQEGEVVGHLNALPQHYRVAGRRLVAHTPGDYMVLPGYGADCGTRGMMRAIEQLNSDVADGGVSQLRDGELSQMTKANVTDYDTVTGQARSLPEG